MTSDPIVLSAVVGASLSLFVAALFNLAREAHRRMSADHRSSKK